MGFGRGFAAGFVTGVFAVLAWAFLDSLWPRVTLWHLSMQYPVLEGVYVTLYPEVVNH